MIDSPPLGHVEIVLMVVTGLVLIEEAVLMFTEVVVGVVVVAVLVETELSFARLQAPGSLSASAFLFSYANKKQTNKDQRLIIMEAQVL